jgi:hypothetical protein
MRREPPCHQRHPHDREGNQEHDTHDDQAHVDAVYADREPGQEDSCRDQGACRPGSDLQKERESALEAIIGT